MESIWPASLTAIFASSSECPEWVGKTVALRIPDAPELTRIVEEVGEPVFSTSVNRGGESPLTNIDAIRSEFGGLVDLIVEGDMPESCLPSTIVDYSGQRAVLVRQGSYPWAGGGNPSKWRSL